MTHKLNSDLQHLQLCLLGGAVGAPAAAQLALALHAFEPGVQPVELLLDLPQLGQGAVELGAGVAQTPLVRAPVGLQPLQLPLLQRRGPPGQQGLAAPLQRVQQGVALRAAPLLFRS